MAAQPHYTTTHKNYSLHFSTYKKRIGSVKLPILFVITGYLLHSLLNRYSLGNCRSIVIV